VATTCDQRDEAVDRADRLYERGRRQLERDYPDRSDPDAIDAYDALEDAHDANLDDVDEQ
jgi:hypothetical protein